MPLLCLLPNYFDRHSGLENSLVIKSKLFGGKRFYNLQLGGFVLDFIQHHVCHPKHFIRDLIPCGVIIFVTGFVCGCRGHNTTILNEEFRVGKSDVSRRYPIDRSMYDE